MNHKQYDDDFKKSIVNLIQNGKTQVQVAKEYGISLSAIIAIFKNNNSNQNGETSLDNLKLRF